MCYRVAWRAEGSDVWEWKSTPLSSYQGALGFLQLYRALPKDRLRLFVSSAEDLDAQLERANSRSSRLRQAAPTSSAVPPLPEGAARHLPSVPEMTETWQRQRLEQRRLEMERGPGGDADQPFSFSLPTSRPEMLAWIDLVVRVRQGELEP